MPNIQCQNCGALWPDTAPQMMRFASSTYPQGRMSEGSVWLSPGEILAAGDEMTHCPKCPDERLDSAMYRGDDRRTSGDEDERPLEDR